MKSIIFVVEGDTSQRILLHDYLERAGYTVCAFSSDEGVMAAAEDARPVLVLISTELSGVDGISLCGQIRRHSFIGNLPVVLLGASRNEDELVRGLGQGADDYMHKPFSLPEMAARIRAVLRRVKRTEVPLTTQAGPLELNRVSMSLSFEGLDVPLSVTEFRLLDHLVSNPGRVFTRDQILDAVWGGEFFVQPSTINVHMRRLRTKIEPDPARPQFLTTVHGVGYRFDVPEEEPGRAKKRPTRKAVLPEQPINVVARQLPRSLEMEQGAA